MKAVIPVAGIGSRLRPHTFSMPKALVPVAGKPILGHILDQLLTLDVQDVVLIIGQAGERIRTYVDAEYPFSAQYVVQRETLGIAHAVHQVHPFLDSEPALIVLGDTVYHADFSRLREGLPTSAIGVKAMEGDLRRYGLVEVEGERVTRLVEKPEHPQSDLVIAGVYYIARPPVLLECIDELIRSGRTTRGEYQLTDALQVMLDHGEPMTIFPVEEWHDCGTPDRLLAANRRLLERYGAAYQVDGSTIIPPVAISTDARISASVIGPFVSISGGAVVSQSVIADSIVCGGAWVQDCRLDASIVGADARISGAAGRINVGERCEVVLQGIADI